MAPRRPVRPLDKSDISLAYPRELVADFENGDLILVDENGSQKNIPGELSIETSGSGNAVTNVEVSEHTVKVTKDATYLTEHPDVAVTSDGTASESPDHGESFTAISGITKDDNGHVTKVTTKTITLPTLPDETDVSVTVTGSGNAVTGASVTGHAVTLTKGATFLTEHPTISKSTDTEVEESPAHGGTFTAVSGVERDGNGHVTAIETKEVTLPSETNVTVKSTGSGNAVTSLEVSGHQVTFVKGTNFLTAHPGITTEQDTTSSAQPGAGGTFDVVDSVERDVNGHVINVNTKTVTMPEAQEFSESPIDVTVTGSGNAVTGISANGHDVTVTKGATFLTAHPAISMGTNGTDTAVTPDHGESFSVVSSITKDANGHVTKYNTKNVTLPSETDVSVTVTGTGNAVTGASVEGHAVTLTKGATFLTAHPTISKTADSSDSDAPGYGGTFDVVDSVTRDGNGHVTKINTKTITMPSEQDIPDLELGTTIGSGNAVTGISVSGHTITMTKGSTFLTAHPIISVSTDGSDTANPGHGESFTAIGAITKDANGHITKVTTRTVTLPTVPTDIAGNAASADTATEAGKLSTPVNIGLSGVTATAQSFDGSKAVTIPVTAVPASLLTGTIAIERLPQAALERFVPVASDTARLALTTANVQNGDVVKVTATGLMYYVKDDSKLGTEAAFEPFTAGTASAVDWSGINNMPDTVGDVSLTPAGKVGDKSLTPEGTVTSSFTGTAAEHNHSFTGTAATLSDQITPAGTVAAEFKGTAAEHNHSFTGTESEHNHSFSGSMSHKHEFTGTAGTATGAFTPAGTVASEFKGTAANHNHSFSGSASHNHSFTGTAAEHTHTFTGTKATLIGTITPGAEVTSEFKGTAAEHNHTFTGTAANHNHTFTGTAGTATATYTPAGSVTADFKGTAANHNHSFSGSASHNHGFTGTQATISSSFTPAGTVAAEFKGTAAEHNHSFTGTAANHNHTFSGSASHNHGFTGTQATISSSFTPAGSVGNTTAGGSVSSTFTGNAGTTGAATGTSINQITGVGSLPTLSSTVSNQCVTLNFGQGSLPTSSAVNVTLNTHTHSFTPAGTIASTFTGTAHNHSFSGTAGTATATYTPAGTVGDKSVTISGTVADAKLTPAGTIGNKSLTPAGSIINAKFTGNAGTATASFTPAGTIADAKLTPAGTIGNKSLTPAGSVSTTFSGNEATFSIDYTPAGTITNTSITPAGTIGDKTVTISGTVGNASITPTGTVNSTFTGTEGSISASYTPAGTVKNTTVTISGTSGNTAITPAGTIGNKSITPAGTIINAKFTGTPVNVSIDYTPAGTIGNKSITPAGNVTSTFKGNAATHNHSFTGTAATHNHAMK